VESQGVARVPNHKKCVSKFLPRPPLSGLIPDSVAPHSASRRRRSSEFAVGARLCCRRAGGALMTAGSGLVERYGRREIAYNKFLILGKKSSHKNRHYRFRAKTRARSPESRGNSDG
jgi:hypothetical protein